MLGCFCSFFLAFLVEVTDILGVAVLLPRFRKNMANRFKLFF
jgi:UPF0716 family protein affecting phage T7 exclusion